MMADRALSPGSPAHAKRMLRQVHRPRQSPTKRVAGLALLLAGTVVTLLAIFADTLEIGTGQGFGYYQMIVLIAGIVLLLGGATILLQSRASRPGGDDPDA